MDRGERKGSPAERTLEALEDLPPLPRALAVPFYLVAAFWPWWLTFFVVALLLWQIALPTAALAWATGIFGTLAAGGYLVKWAIEWVVLRHG